MLKEEKFKVNSFFYYANLYRQKAVPDEEIEAINMTDEFWKEMENEIRNDELPNININAKVRMAKSTTGIEVAKQLYNKMVEIKRLKGKEPFGIKNIARDQQEYCRMMSNPDVNWTVILTDEINELEETGENVTAERALNSVFSNVQAGRYVYRVSCSPASVTDPNADVFLEIIGVDRKRKITHCHLYYRMLKGGDQYMQLLGYVEINVGDLIKEWLKIKEDFFKNDTKKDQEITKKIEKARKKDFYVEYMCRKYEKMKLITEEGIMRPRELEYAEVIMETIVDLIALTRTNILTKDTIKSYILMKFRNHRIPTSIIGEELATQRANAVLSLYKLYFKLGKSIIDLEKKYEETGKQELREKVKVITNEWTAIDRAIKAQMEELNKMIEIKKKYEIQR